MGEGLPKTTQRRTGSERSFLLLRIERIRFDGVRMFIFLSIKKHLMLAYGRFNFRAHITALLLLKD